MGLFMAPMDLVESVRIWSLAWPIPEARPNGPLLLGEDLPQLLLSLRVKTVLRITQRFTVEVPQRGFRGYAIFLQHVEFGLLLR